MQPDDELCLCFHITKRKITNYIRIEKPRRVSQISECFGAGTGCGWCRPFLQRLFDEAGQDDGDCQNNLPDKEEYGQLRKKYMDEKKQQRNS